MPEIDDMIAEGEIMDQEKKLDDERKLLSNEKVVRPLASNGLPPLPGQIHIQEALKGLKPENMDVMCMCGECKAKRPAYQNMSREQRNAMMLKVAKDTKDHFLKNR